MIKVKIGQYRDWITEKGIDPDPFTVTKIEGDNVTVEYDKSLYGETEYIHDVWDIETGTYVKVNLEDELEKL